VKRVKWGKEALAALFFGLAACGGGPSEALAPPAQVTPEVPLAPPAPAPYAPVTNAAPRPPAGSIEALLERVSDVRGLPIRRAVPAEVLSRPAMRERMRAQAERETPREKLAQQGEGLTALGLLPPSYDFVAGVFGLLESEVAGFYDPLTQTMYLAEDLDAKAREETLLHELVHALQDQSYSLLPLTQPKPGEGDRLAAAHALAEGDATAAMYAAAGLRVVGQTTTAEAEPPPGSDVPPVLWAALLAPYVDGLSFVEKQRKKGGFPAVDQVWERLPDTTEQLLHEDKLAAREPALPVRALDLAKLGAGYALVDDDVMGEQGLRIVLERWVPAARAAEAAAGWGGDKLAIVRCAGCAGGDAYAAVWRFVFDSEADAAEMASVLSERFGARCRERADLGPLLWKRRGAKLALVAGPHVRLSGSLAVRPGAKCSAVEGWMAGLLD
jgi:hypothetical protein